MNFRLACALVFSISFLETPGPAAEGESVRIVGEVKSGREARPLYVGNRDPLLPSPLMKLPIGSIRPKGWLRHQLVLEAEGMTGRLPEISKWCKFEGNAWVSADGHGHSGWEELPYWLKGYGDLGYVLKDDTIIRETRKWIDGVLSSQEKDGWFGPRSLKTSLKGQPDLWPHMVMLNVLQSFHESTRDDRVIPFMLKYHRWLNAQPGETFRNGYWPNIRWGDNIETVCWLYNRTGESFLLDLAKKIHDNMARWSDDVINWHNVNIAQGFREPGVFYQQSKDPLLLRAAERNYQKVMGLYGQFPGGGFAGDENCRPGYTDPRQGFETCGIVEFMHSFEMLTKISGDPIWSDRCEDLAFNSFPASATPDWKALHYLTCANQIRLDRHNKAPAIENGGTMFSYSPFEGYRCCQHNVAHGWPYYAEELWLATADRGLCASLYAASEITAKVGEGSTVTIAEETDYPFSDTITLRVLTPKAVAFPLYLRIPRWCDHPAVTINGRAMPFKTRSLSYLILERSWADGDVITLRLPMAISLRRWEKNNNAVSVDYGPLTFSLKIGEKWERYGKNETWPEWEVLPTTAWNYGLELDFSAPEESFEVIKKPGLLPPNPFTPQTTPLELRAKGRKIPAWVPDKLGMVGKLQTSPARSEEPLETVSLIPMGAARLRISSFPTVGRGKENREWVVPKAPPISASFAHASDSVEAMIDGVEPKSSGDQSIPRFTFWDHRGTAEWVEWGFPKARKISSVELYWFDDTGAGQCRVPQSWKVSYRVGERWLPLEEPSGFATASDTYNRVTFKPVEAEGLRLDLQLQPNYSAGILEWKVGE
jgi:hypothetical protein